MSKQENTKASGWDFRRLEENLGYAFQNPKLLKTALTHSSYANEAHNGTRSNERLEFLGDAVLSIVVSDYIFRNCPHLPEGELTKMRASLVCEKSLQRFSRVLEIGSFLRLSRGEQNSGGAERSSILADAFEDYKTALQEIVQQNPEEKLNYVLVGESGPDHNKHFVVEVHLNSNVIGKGGGRSKKEAEQQAAREALELMGY